jgi:hypothetical protein
MKNAILVLLTLAFASGARAADPTTSQSMSGTPKAPKPTSAPKKSQEKLSPTEQKAKDLDLAKVRFMSAVGACAKPEECDPGSPRKNADLVSLLKAAQDAFVEACIQCGSDEVCAEEADRIKQGRARSGKNVCLAPVTKPKAAEGDKKKAASSTGAEKKPATGATPSK